MAGNTDIEETGLFSPILGHVGVGIFHMAICAKENKRTEFDNADAYTTDYLNGLFLWMENVRANTVLAAEKENS